MLGRVDEALDLGYRGIYLDIVDGCNVSQVKNAYPGTDTELRQEMIDFVIALSEHAKARDPNFQVIPQNAVGLLAVNENNPDSGPNTPYLEAINGLGIEDLWYDGNNTSSWTNRETIVLHDLLTSDPFDNADQVGENVVFTFEGGDVLTIVNTTIMDLQDDLIVG